MVGALLLSVEGEREMASKRMDESIGFRHLVFSIRRTEIKTAEMLLFLYAGKRE